ncbi:MAG: PAS domain S-box protein [Alphaproteobacteria bacterium]|nr:PAS domain S-box protein [Alphaproteobacteria bacterium]
MPAFHRPPAAAPAVPQGDPALRLAAHLGAALDSAGIGALLLDRDGRILDASPAFQLLLGYDIAELRGRDEASVVHAADRAHSVALLERLSGRDDPSLESEKRYLPKDGGEVWVRATITAARDAAGRTQAFTIVVQDIAQRRQIEQARRDSEARLRDVIEAAGCLWVETDARFRITQAQMASTAHSVQSLDALIGRSLSQATGVSDPGLDPTWRDVQTLMRAHQPFRDVRYTLVDGQGRTHYRRASGVPAFDAEGRFAGYRCLAIDETAEIEARARANATEGLLHMAIEGMSDGFAVFDAEDRFVLMNRRYRESLPPDTEWIRPGLTFEEILRIGVASGHYLEAIGNEEAFIAERLREHREGRGARLVRAIGNRWCRARDHRLPDGSTVIIRTDVTELVERERELQDREEQLRAIAGNLPGFIFRMVVAADGTFGNAYVSERLKEIIGVPAEEITSGRGTLLEHVHADDRERLMRGLTATVADPRPSLIEVRMVNRPTGDIHWLRLHTTSKKLPDGAQQWDGIGIDVTDRKAAEDRLLQSQKTEAIGQLTGGVAHDFNNLLTVITGCAELLSEALPKSDHANAELVRNILTAGHRGAELTHQLLAFARKQPLTPRTVDVNQLIAELRPLLVGPLGEDIELRFDLRADPTVTRIDAHQLQNAIINLAVNARDAMPSGGKLLVETANVALDLRQAAEIGDVKPGRYIIVRVVDTGTGMPAEVAARAIEPFFTTKPTGKGTGLGLSMVYGFVKQSGGHMTIASVPGEGTTVRLLLPQAGATGAAGADGTVASDRPRGSETILLVDDEAEIRVTTAELLRRLGYTVHCLGSGGEVIAALEQQTEKYDILVLDISMPGMDGRETLRRLRESGYTVPVLMATGHSAEAEGGLARQLGATGVIQKPFAVQRLAGCIRAALDTPQTREDPGA